MDLDQLLGPIETVLDLVPSVAPWVGTVIAVLIILAVLPRKKRLPHHKRDPVRLYTWHQKKQLINVAAGRCEHKHPLWRRCPQRGAEDNHIVPWSRGGRTTLSNGQLLCRKHNRRKSDIMPSLFYRWRLKQRRRRY